ncbi:hypothetical protein QUC31_017983 [Theobroma cacao]
MKSIDISRNRNLTGQLPEFPLISILQFLSLYGTNFSGKLPESLDNLKFLTHLDLCRCNFFGQVPSAIANLTNLVYLDLSYNYLRGSIPKSIFKLPRLEELYIGYNNFDSLKLDMFSQLKNLRGLDLSNMSFSIGRNNKSLTFPHLETLRLRSCNLTEFPEFIKTQDKLVDLHLSNNQIRGFVPNWLWKSTLRWKCKEAGVPPSSPGEDADSLVDGITDWKIVLIGYGCGLVIGLCIGYTVLNEMGNKWRDKCRRNGKKNHRRSRNLKQVWACRTVTGPTSSIAQQEQTSTDNRIF